MKITEVKAYVVAAAMPKPWRIGNYVLEKGYAVIVEVVTDEGISGFGEAIGRLGPVATKKIIDDLLGPCIVGSDPMEIEGLWQRMFHLMRFRGHSRGYFMEAVSGVDIALWDVAGKALNLPVHRLMLGCNRVKVPVYASSIFWDSPHAMADVATDLVEGGFGSIKVKVGQGVETDMTCLEAIRDAVGPDVQLTVDANGAYGFSEAIRLGRGLEELDVRWFEEPTPADDLDAYENLSARLDVPVAAGEAEFSIHGVREIIERGVQIIQPDVSRAGGISGVRRIATLCEAFHVAYAPHTGASSGVCMAASLQLAAAVPNLLIYEHMVGDNPLVDALFFEPLPRPKNGVIAIPKGPGLGIKVDRKALEKYRVS
jgi:L-alanine-DL-glutamate epimerase-like enolase superfamily enzyme